MSRAMSAGVAVLAVLAALLIAALMTSLTEAASCPALHSPDMDVQCRLNGSLVPCETQPVEPGSTAVMKCKPRSSGAAAAGQQLQEQSALCEPDGRWSKDPPECQPVCGMPSSSSISSVDGKGRRVSSASELPWNVALYKLQRDDHQYVCGGVLISTKFFITAAFCFHGSGTNPLPPENFTAAVSKILSTWDVEEPGAEKKAVSRIFLNKYGGRKHLFRNNVGLAEFREPVQISAQVMPACLDWNHRHLPLQNDEEGVVASFGLVVGKEEDLRLSVEKLLLGKFTKLSEEKCEEGLPDNLLGFTLVKDMFCVGTSSNDDIRLVRGSSGSSMVVQRQQRWYLQGIVSVGSINPDNLRYFLTNVTTHLSWIRNIVEDHTVL